MSASAVAVGRTNAKGTHNLKRQRKNSTQRLTSPSKWCDSETDTGLTQQIAQKKRHSLIMMKLRRRKSQDEDEEGKKKRRWGFLRQGTRGLIMKGKEHFGEKVTVVDVKAVMIGVELDEVPDEGRFLKRPESLLLLGDGIEVRRDRKGRLWVTREDSPRSSPVTIPAVSQATVEECEAGYQYHLRMRSAFIHDDE